MGGVSDDPVAFLFHIGLGQWLTPLRGKIPYFDAWQSMPPVDEDVVRDWLDAGFNIGLRTGERSGVVVIDDDQARNGGGDYRLPPTGLVVATPTGGQHGYYRAPTPCPRNSASKLAPHVDVRGEGGQVVVPPSVHPLARAPYRWESLGEPGTFPALPEPVRLDMTAPEPVRGGGYAETALVREAARVRVADEGTRNDTLNRAAFSLGQLVAGGALPEDRVVAELTAAAAIAGLDDGETATTIRSGLKAGHQSPRTAPERPATVTTVVGADHGQTAPDVLVPGSHVIKGGEYVEQGNHAFAHDVLSRLDPEALYRRGGVLGEIAGGSFAPVAVNRLRSVIDASVRLAAGKPPKADEDEPSIVFRPCSRDLAAVVLDYGQARGGVRELVHLATYPACIGPDFEIASPGWNSSAGVYLDTDLVPEPLPLDEARAVLEDLVVDFPFQSNADRANFFGLLLTPILRPALMEPVPMHLVLSPVERTGKSKLAELVLGISVTGRPLEAAQFGEREEEREKRILSVLLAGQSLWHLDNLTDFLGSAALASLITCRQYQGRLLGSSVAPTVANTLTIVGSGNNVHATGEITKRIVPIRLLPDTENPEDRTDFRHPDLTAYLHESRPRVLGALMGMIEAWKAAGRPLHGIGFGGFERWAAVTGGILTAAGYPEWLSNLREWRGVSDDTGEEHKALVAAWYSSIGTGWTDVAAVCKLAVDLDIYGWLDKSKSDRAQRISFARKALAPIVGRVFATQDGVHLRVESEGVGVRRRVRVSKSDD